MTWWQGDGTVYVGRASPFFPCRPVYLYDAGDGEAQLDCVDGLAGVPQVQLNADHDCTLPPPPCPPIHTPQNALPLPLAAPLDGLLTSPVDRADPLTPMAGCPPNPSSAMGGGWAGRGRVCH
jgi:hypothetical protein